MIAHDCSLIYTQVFALCAAKLCWCFGHWIDQGKRDPSLRPPYAYGWHAAVIMMVCCKAGLFTSKPDSSPPYCPPASPDDGRKQDWATIAFDQAFPSPGLFTVLYMLHVFAVGTCQQNRRGYPSLQMAEEHKERAGGFKAFKVVGSVMNKVHRVVISGVTVTLLALQWYDKNVVTMLSNKHTANMVDYTYRCKGEVDSLLARQPETREEYNLTNNGVDGVDQKNSATINPHGSKQTIWHRVHDHFFNQAMHMAITHYMAVINEHGDEDQQTKLFGKVVHGPLPADAAADGERQRKGGQRTDDLWWRLIYEMTEQGAHFGTVGDPHVCNLRAGTPTPLARPATFARRTPSPTAAPAPSRRRPHE